MKKAILSLLPVLVFTGCEFPQGGRTKLSSKCSSAWHRGACTIKIDLLEASYTYALANDDFHYYGSSTEVRARVSSKQGRVKFWFKEPNLKVREVIVEPGKDAVIEGPAYVWSMADKNEVNLYFEFLEQGPGQAAKGVQVDLEYRMGSVGAPWRG